MAVDNTQSPLAVIHLAFEDEEAAAVAAAGGVKIEPDSERNRTTDDEGNDVEKTSFQPGDPYYFLVYHSDDVRITGQKACAGSVFYKGMTTRTREDICAFTELNSADNSPNKPTISYVPAGGFSTDWYTGYSSEFGVGGGLSRDIDLSLKISSGKVPCQVKLSYPVSFHSFDFFPPNDLTLDPTDENDSVDIYIVIYLESTE